ncbi:hypothetical protein LSG31_22700 [Fodinisporobacter ferrooxydans]|uniref:Uncharacterized protein n=1 Tax=Fodinisporobacter ferrooxydans TaxID=2901836 RepID=A0ABY4CJC8_9BACL|nr:hypothetical protein LSG31_22700 [Alicyclobacillaceae bacterium MYW30-H2]
MQWKQLWTVPAQGGVWMLQKVGKWMEDAGRFELSQWDPYYDSTLENSAMIEEPSNGKSSSVE